jgi:hypothetical protein
MSAIVRPPFYRVIAQVLVLLVVIGFARTYYLRVLFDLPPLTLLVHLHGIVFTAWLALFVVQTRLIARHNYLLHRKLGILGVVLAAAVVVIGIFTALVGAGSPRPRPMGFSGEQFLIFPLVGIVFFAVCVGAAVALRRQAALHKRLMLLAMIAVLGPAVARLVRLSDLGQHFLAIQTGVALCFVIWALAHDWRRYRMVHPVFAVGGALLVLSWPVRAAVAGSDTWLAIARWMTG